MPIEFDIKLASKDITIDWYKNAFLSEKLPSDEICINSGLNKKTISNMYRSATKQIVIDASMEHFDSLYNSIQALVDNEHEIDLTLTIKFKGVSVDLNVNEKDLEKHQIMRIFKFYEKLFNKF